MGDDREGDRKSFVTWSDVWVPRDGLTASSNALEARDNEMVSLDAASVPAARTTACIDEAQTLLDVMRRLGRDIPGQA